MKTESYSPALQLASLLPHHDDLKAGFDIFVAENGEKMASSWEGAVRRLTAGIIKNPDDTELWHDMACAFGQWGMLQWKYLFVAHRIDPGNTRYTEALAWAFYHMGDHNQAIGLVNKAIATADKDEDRLSLIKSKMMMENQPNINIV